MTRSILLIFSIYCLSISTIHSQCNTPFTPSYIFEEPPLFCEGLHGFCSELPPLYTEQELPGCPFDEFLVHNGQLLKFIAGSESITISINPTSCEMNPDGFGVQGVIYEQTHPFLDFASPLVVSCGAGNGEDIILASNTFIVGCTYYLLVDGWSAAMCDYEIDVNAGTTSAPDFIPAPEIFGPTQVCEGQQAVFSVIGESCNYDWSVGGADYDSTSSGSTIMVEITDANSFIICAKANNGCYSSLETCFTTEIVEVESTDSLISDQLCVGSEYIFFDQVLTSPGNYVDSIQIDCELITFYLTLNEEEPSETVDSIAICPGNCVTYYGEEYCDEGEYVFNEIASNGCDSINQLIITEIPAATSEFSAEFCTSILYEWNDELYDSPGVYEQLFVAANGCDSVVTLVLSVELIEASTSIHLCQGESYEYDGVVYTDDASVETSATSIEGCDSLNYFSISFSPKPFYDTVATICELDSFQLGPHVLYDAGSYQLEIPSTSVCDTTVFLVLEVIPIFLESVEATICPGDSLEYGDKYYSIEGNYTIYRDGGCDSVVSLNLNFHPNMDVIIDTTITIGETYEGILILGDTVIVETFIDDNGCNSVKTVNIKTIVSQNLYEATRSFSIFPNPSRDKVHLFIEKGYRTLDVYSILGENVLHIDLSKVEDRKQITIDVGTFSAGTYFFVAGNGAEAEVRKLVVLN